MEESVVLYGLLITTTINTILLLLLVIALVKAWFMVSGLIKKAESMLERGEREVMSTIAVTRTVLQQGGNLLGKLTNMLERYLLFSTLNRFASSPRLSKLMTGIGVGYGIVQAVQKYFFKSTG